MNKLKGIIVPMVTPLDHDRQIDYPGAARLVEHMIKGGVHAIFVLGTTGESQSLSIEDRKKFVGFVGNAISGQTLPSKIRAVLPGRRKNQEPVPWWPLLRIISVRRRMT